MKYCKIKKNYESKSILKKNLDKDIRILKFEIKNQSKIENDLSFFRHKKEKLEDKLRKAVAANSEKRLINIGNRMKSMEGLLKELQ